jgi:hypothetical protein
MSNDYPYPGTGAAACSNTRLKAGLRGGGGLLRLRIRDGIDSHRVLVVNVDGLVVSRELFAVRCPRKEKLLHMGSARAIAHFAEINNGESGRRVRMWSRIASRLQFSSQGSGGRANERSSKAGGVSVQR